MFRGLGVGDLDARQLAEQLRDEYNFGLPVHERISVDQVVVDPNVGRFDNAMLQLVFAQ